MHPALQLTEILLNIFSHWRAPQQYRLSYATEPLGSADLAALARTCRLFKEPALDVLWSVLANLIPLALCLPQACDLVMMGGFIPRYRFQRPIEQAEWDILRRYTHRIRSVHDINTFFWHDVEDFLNPPDPLFPNLRHLRYVCLGADPVPVLYHPLPSLVSVTYALTFDDDTNHSQFEGHLEQFPGGSPMLGQLTLQMVKPEVVIDSVVSKFICGWPNPRIVTCHLVTLNTDAFKHLSRASNLTSLCFTLDSTLLNAITRSEALRFNRLEVLELRSKSLVPVSEIFSRIQLPAIADLYVIFDDTPTKQNLASLLETVQTSGACISNIALTTKGSTDGSVGLVDELVRDDLLPFMTFKNLRCLELDIRWDVGLVDDDLVELVSEWPHLERLIINRCWGWRQTPESRGITPNGVIRLLRTCPSLIELVVAVDTQSSVEALLGPSPDDLGTLDVPRCVFINVIDSTIEAASIPRMVTFFTHLLHLMPSSRLTVRVCSFCNPCHYGHWWDLFTQVQEAVGQDGRFCILD